MRLYNTTDSVQKIVVYDRLEHACHYDLYVQPHSPVDIDYSLRVEGIQELLDSGVLLSSEAVIEKKEEKVTTEPEIQLVPEEKGIEETQVAETSVSEFICDICGGEFSSARSLSSHKRRAHAE